MTIDEMTSPLPTRIRGTVRLYPGARTDTRIALDAAGQAGHGAAHAGGHTLLRPLAGRGTNERRGGAG
jgi:hypothetical protein